MKPVRPIDANELKDVIELSTAISLSPVTVGDIFGLIDTAPTVKPPTHDAYWRDCNKEQPTKDGVYFAAYDFWCWNNCMSTRKFENGKWTEEDERGAVKFWMPIPTLPED